MLNGIEMILKWFCKRIGNVKRNNGFDSQSSSILSIKSLVQFQTDYKTHSKGSIYKRGARWDRQCNQSWVAIKASQILSLNKHPSKTSTTYIIFFLILPVPFCRMEFPNELYSAVTYSLSKGLLHGEFINGEQYFTHMPFSLFPFPVPFEFRWIDD